MSSTGPIATLSPRDYDAVLFDMDGVLTQTASVHATAWKQLFDAFLEQRSAASGWIRSRFHAMLLTTTAALHMARHFHAWCMLG